MLLRRRRRAKFAPAGGADGVHLTLADEKREARVFADARGFSGRKRVVEDGSSDHENASGRKRRQQTRTVLGDQPGAGQKKQV
jgi:hypothetical protein